MLHRETIHTVIDYYDRPILYTCYDEKGRWYLVVLSEETEYKEVFLYVELSTERILKLFKRELDLHSAYRGSDVVLQRTNYFGSRIQHWQWIPTVHISDNLLPSKGAYINRK